MYITLLQNSAIKEIVSQIGDTAWQRCQDTKRDYAESVYVTEEGVSLRMIVVRWHKKGQIDLFESPYGYHVIGTNENEGTLAEIIAFHSGRMVNENYNKELKDGYSCDWTPSHNFTMNMNYFYAGVLAYNCVEMLKQFFIEDKDVVSYRIKKLRHWFIKISGKLEKTGRKYYFHVTNVTEKTYQMMHSVWRRLQYAW